MKKKKTLGENLVKSLQSAIKHSRGEIKLRESKRSTSEASEILQKRYVGDNKKRATAIKKEVDKLKKKNKQ